MLNYWGIDNQGNIKIVVSYKLLDMGLNNRVISKFVFFLFVGYAFHSMAMAQHVPVGTIDRKEVVERHTILITKYDSLSSLSVGNGVFAFTADVTGLQTFPDDYAKGVPLGTESEWGWHSFPNEKGYKYEEVLKTYHFNGKEVKYAVEMKQPIQNKEAVDYFRLNPHRLQLGNIGFEITLKNGKLASINDIENIHQTLNVWTGELKSSFSIENIPVEVITYCHQDKDEIAVRVKSDLIESGRIAIRLRFPYPTHGWKDVGNNWTSEEMHNSTIVSQTQMSAVIKHSIDSTTYFANLGWNITTVIKEKSKHYFVFVPSKNTKSFEFSCQFIKSKVVSANSSFAATKENNQLKWNEFWNSGGAIEFAGSTDKRAFELERRVVLSQYLTKIQCAGNNPPQETGLTYNSWYGRPHLEMFWWHAVHYALWGRIDLLEKSLSWYNKAITTAKQIAERQGCEGLRWPKMTDNEGRETPSSVGSFLLWQQPHLIYFAELCYRNKSDDAVLKRYKDIVFATADFMVSYPYYDSSKGKYILGKGVQAAQERFKPEETYNPAYELAYWHWALSIAQLWRERLHLPPNKKWDTVSKQLSPLTIKDGKYLFTENGTDSYTNPRYATDHPSVLGAFGMLPRTHLLDTAIMQNTFNWVLDNWTWKDTWGWDFPMTAMTATRLGMPNKAIDALFMDIKTNTFLTNGHNYKDERLPIYLPANGGILTAVALMCAGYDDNNNDEPGIPKDGKWKVRWEGLKKIP